MSVFVRLSGCLFHLTFCHCISTIVVNKRTHLHQHQSFFSYLLQNDKNVRQQILQNLKQDLRHRTRVLSALALSGRVLWCGTGLRSLSRWTAMVASADIRLPPWVIGKVCTLSTVVALRNLLLRRPTLHCFLFGPNLLGSSAVVNLCGIIAIFILGTGNWWRRAVRDWYRPSSASRGQRRHAAALQLWIDDFGDLRNAPHQLKV